MFLCLGENTGLPVLVSCCNSGEPVWQRRLHSTQCIPEREMQPVSSRGDANGISLRERNESPKAGGKGDSNARIPRT